MFVYSHGTFSRLSTMLQSKLMPLVYRTCQRSTVMAYPSYYAQVKNIFGFSPFVSCYNYPSKASSTFMHIQLKSSVEISYTGIRKYAKSKDKRKSDKGKKKIEINEQQLAEVIKVDSLKTQMQRAIDTLKDDYIKSVSLRSTTGAIESLKITLDGKEYFLQEVAQIVRKNPKTVILNMAVFPQAIPSVLKALSTSGMNLNPQQDGTAIYIPVPKVTKEHRENLAKNAKALFIKCRDAIKDVQNKYLKLVKNNTTISEDISHQIQDQITGLGQQYIAEADKILESKQAELIGKD